MIRMCRIFIFITVIRFRFPKPICEVRRGRRRKRAPVRHEVLVAATLRHKSFGPCRVPDIVFCDRKKLLDILQNTKPANFLNPACTRFATSEYVRKEI